MDLIKHGGKVAILPKMRRRTNDIKSTTARQFDGGLNVVDSELNLSSRYARVLDNIYRSLEGAVSVRQGCKLYVDLESISSGNQINGRYFASHNITVNSIGEVFAIDGAGNAIRIWDSVIAASKRPGLVTWGLTDFVEFEEFGGQLSIHNGQDKPLRVTSGLDVDYLADPATGSNINVPIGRIVCKFAKHLVVAVGSSIYVSDENTDGVWANDAGATYAAIFDMRTSVASGPTDIIGLLPFRDFLLIQFRECTIPIQFKKTTSPDALTISDTSDVGGTLNSYGSIANRTTQDLGELALACDIAGVTSVALATFTTKLSPDRPSRLVNPLIKKAVTALGNSTLEDGVFSQYDRVSSMYMLFVPNAVRDSQIETRGFGYRYIDKLNIEAWNTFSGWNWAWSSRSSEGLIFFGQANSNKIFVKGDEETLPLYADYIGDQETFSDGTVFTDGLGLFPISDLNTSGVPIRWIWEIPWSDLKNRAIQKSSRYLILDTEGSATFNVKAFIDNKYIDDTDTGEEFSDDTLFYDDLGFKRDALYPALSHALTLDFVGSNYGGYGNEPYGDIYGGGRNTKFARLMPFPTKFNMFKLRLSGETMRPLKIVGITPAWLQGSIRRNSDV